MTPSARDKAKVYRAQGLLRQQRAARKAAEARKAEREAEKRAAETGAAATAATAVAPKAESKPAVAAAPDIDELYGAVPHAKKAAPKPAATVAAAAPKPAPAPKKAQSADDLFEDDAEKEE